MGNKKLTIKEIKEIKIRYINGEKQNALAKKYKVTPPSIRYVLNRAGLIGKLVGINKLEKEVGIKKGKFKNTKKETKIDFRRVKINYKKPEYCRHPSDMVKIPKGSAPPPNIPETIKLMEELAIGNKTLTQVAYQNDIPIRVLRYLKEKNALFLEDIIQEAGRAKYESILDFWDKTMNKQCNIIELAQNKLLEALATPGLQVFSDGLNPSQLATIIKSMKDSQVKELDIREKYTKPVEVIDNITSLADLLVTPVLGSSIETIEELIVQNNEKGDDVVN